MKKNSKGFTLVELLAVIVILAVIILIAVNAVLPQMQKARKKSFADEGLSFAKAGETAYVDRQLSGNQFFSVGTDKTPTVSNEAECTSQGGTYASSTCTVKSLKAEYVTKTDANYKGCIKVEADSEGNITGKTIWLASDKWMIINKTSDVLGNNLDKNVVPFDSSTWDSDYDTCTFN